MIQKSVLDAIKENGYTVIRVLPNGMVAGKGALMSKNEKLPTTNEYGLVYLDFDIHYKL